MRATTKLTNPTHPIRLVRSFRSLVSLARPQVHYRRWSSRFDEWIDPSRIMRNDEEGRKQQERMHLNYEYKNRKHQGLEEENGEEDDEFEGEKGGMGDLKKTILALEADLPVHGIARGNLWDFDRRSCWRGGVESAENPTEIIKLMLILESIINIEIIKPGTASMYATLPTPTKSIKDASLGSAWLRVQMLELCLDFSPMSLVYVSVDNMYE